MKPRPELEFITEFNEKLQSILQSKNLITLSEDVKCSDCWIIIKKGTLLFGSREVRWEPEYKECLPCWLHKHKSLMKLEQDRIEKRKRAIALFREYEERITDYNLKKAI